MSMSYDNNFSLEQPLVINTWQLNAYGSESKYHEVAGDHFDLRLDSTWIPRRARGCLHVPVSVVQRRQRQRPVGPVLGYPPHETIYVRDVRSASVPWFF